MRACDRISIVRYRTDFRLPISDETADGRLQHAQYHSVTGAREVLWKGTLHCAQGAFRTFPTTTISLKTAHVTPSNTQKSWYDYPRKPVLYCIVGTVYSLPEMLDIA